MSESWLRKLLTYIWPGNKIDPSEFKITQEEAISIAQAARIVALVFGSALLFPGLGLSLWGRLVLGKMYNVSSALGAQL